MEIELKIRLRTLNAYEKAHKAIVSELGPQTSAAVQDNFFLDGPDSELSKQKIVFRLRRNKDLVTGAIKKYVVTFKGKAVLEAGISRVQESEVEIEASLGHLILKDPNSVFDMRKSIPLVDTFLNSHPYLNSLQIFGSFSTLRRKFPFQDHVLELDATDYTFGPAWEIEIESDNEKIETIRTSIVDLLTRNQIEFGWSKRNKLVNMINGNVL